MATQSPAHLDTRAQTKPAPAVNNLGGFANEAATLRELSRRLVAALDPHEIWLFGSRARNDAEPDSDFDLLVVAKPNGSFGSGDYVSVARPIHGTGIGCDVVPCGYDDYLEARAHPTTLVAMAVKQGRRLYAAPAD